MPSSMLQKSFLTVSDKKGEFIERELGSQRTEMCPGDQARKMYRNNILRAEKQKVQLSFSRDNLPKILPSPPSDTIAITQDTDDASILNEH